jgi:hypothetical protein
MNTKTRNILRGVGSILDIMPERRVVDFSKFVPKKTPTERMAEAWQKVGEDMRAAMGQVANEESNKTAAS